MEKLKFFVDYYCSPLNVCLVVSIVGSGLELFRMLAPIGPGLEVESTVVSNVRCSEGV